ncbi:MAG: alpha-D-ribose 1-methylphosphonate 5-triphosphate diphosphatase [Pseudomonadota bacterium]
MTETIFSDAQIVLEDEIIKGCVRVVDGEIIDISKCSSSMGVDCEGDYLIPGLVELHTDHLENHYNPRPGVTWNLTASIQAHDAQIAASGITTVFDCLRLGTDTDKGFAPGEMRAMSRAISEAQSAGRLRTEHRIHLRCEVSAPDVLERFEEFEDDDAVGLVSLMDHAPGQRQFETMEHYTLYYKGKRGMSDDEFDRFCKMRIDQSSTYSAPHRAALANACRERGIALASHDDAKVEHVAESREYGTSVAEFPTTLTAAKASHEAGMGVLMGAPNIVRGKSHSGNIAARDLADAGVLDILSSDYVPFSLLQAPFILATANENISLPHAIAMVTSNPARQVGLADRGSIQVGKRGDLVRVSAVDHVPIVRSVWREGNRVA